MTVTPLGVEVSCDGPAEQTDCPENAAVAARFASWTAREVRADGRAAGWSRRRRGGHLRDLCPNCGTTRQDGADRG
ncbi:hypothetical protein [Streptomyces sp. SID8352]|uniref:hypothetical protein n=1 Tax=Streptomyces sp. SID8352 TaxID=2690338 RepID=UPI001371CA2C|nr:hypothetical protein [Streptomyces sp. SID8352]MYU24505.1 hypothetical protein [Streptomyces sp. SID8352]